MHIEYGIKCFKNFKLIVTIVTTNVDADNTSSWNCLLKRSLGILLAMKFRTTAIWIQWRAKKFKKEPEKNWFIGILIITSYY